MVLLRKNRLNSLISTASQNAELTNPVFLFSFTNIFTKQTKSFIPNRVETNFRFDEFEFIIGPNENLTASTPTVNFTEDGQYYYSVYEQVSTTNLNPAYALNKLEEGRADLINPDQSSPYDIYESPNENNSNFVYYTDIENQTDVVLKFYISATMGTLSQRTNWYDDGRPFIPFTQSDTGNTYTLERMMTKWLDRSNDVPATIPGAYIQYEEVFLPITGGNQSFVFEVDHSVLNPLGFQQTNAFAVSSFTFTDFVIYDDLTDCLNNEPALSILPSLPTGDTCGRYVVWTYTPYTLSGPQLGSRVMSQEFGGDDCNNSGDFNALLPPYTNYPTIWAGSSFYPPGVFLQNSVFQQGTPSGGSNFNLEYVGIQPATPTPTPTPSSTITPTPTVTLTPTPTPTLAVFDADYQLVLTQATTRGLTLPSYLERIRQNQLVLDLKNAGLWTKLGNFYMFKLDETGAPNSRGFTFMNWKRPTSQPAFINSWDGTVPTFTNNEGWYLTYRSGINLVQNVNTGLNAITTLTTGNTEGGSYKYVVNQIGAFWRTNNNGWNAAQPTNTTDHIIFRNVGLTSAYDFSGDGLKIVYMSGAPSVDTILQFRNDEIATNRTKTNVDINIAGGNMILGAATISSNGVDGLVEFWFHGTNFTSSDITTFEGIMKTYLTS